MTGPTLTLCDDLHLPLSEYARTGLRIGIWASSGRGKSFGVGVVCEELLEAGIPVVALDPEGEMHTLRERFPVVVLGGDRGDIPVPWSEAAVSTVLARAHEAGLSLVVDLSDHSTSRAQRDAALPILHGLWTLATERRTPVGLVVEEVHVFAPQSGAGSTSELLHSFAKQGRKRGVILVTASQRTQSVSKELMSQLNFPAIGGFEIERDYEAVRFLADGRPFDEFRSLPVGEFYFPAAGRRGRWRARHTSHGGESPGFETGARPARREDPRLGALIEELRAALRAEDAGRETHRDDDALTRQIRAIEQRLAAAEEARRVAESEVARLETALKVAGVIKVLVQNEVVLASTSPARPAQALLATAAAVPTSPPSGAPPPVVSPQPAAVVSSRAVPTRPTVRDLGLPADEVIGSPGMKPLVRDARTRARRRAPRAAPMVIAALKVLLAGGTLTVHDLATRTGATNQLTLRRAMHALDGLAGAGLAVVRDGRHVLNEGVVLRALGV